MDATIRRYEGVDENRAVETYADERMARRRRNRAVGFLVCIALWLLAAVPLVRLSSEDGGGTAVAAVYLATGFGLAVLVRAIYALLTRRAVLSPWLFVTAALLAITSYGVLSAGERTAAPGARDAAENAAFANAIPVATTPYAFVA
jgi:hypothetical protein